jgi:DNA-binding MarR family transcriptional regulator
MPWAIMCRMTSTHDTTASGVAAAVERILVGGVGVTTLALTEAPEAAELTLAQWRVLAIVAQRDGVRIGELAGRLGIGVPSASRLVRRLERHGLATAVRDERDRRATLVRASAEGRRVREAVLRRRADLIADALGGRVEQVSADTRVVLDEIGSCLERFA